MFILRGGARIGRHEALILQLATTRYGWVRMDGFLHQIRADYYRTFSVNVELITAEYVASLIIQSDKPRIGVLHERNGYTWLRAWDKQDGVGPAN